MIKNIEKVLNVSETKLRYRKKETMTGLYFKEMLSKITGSKNKQDKHKDNKRENEVETLDNSSKEPEGEGNFLDELC